MTCRWLVAAPLLLVSLSGLPARAGNEPEKAERRVREDIVPKVALACGVSLSVKYDGESLRKHNLDIARDQTDGDNECNEPLRYLWYACRTDAGKAAVKAARISGVACRGAAGPTGTLTLTSGTLTAGRAFEEPQPYVRSRKQFEALLKLELKLASEDPYSDETWRALAQQPNPVTSTTTYCLVNGEKVAFDENVYSPFFHRKQDAQIRCWKDGPLVMDLQLRQGRKTGFLTQFHGKGSRRVSYRDDKRHGEEKTIEDGKVASLAAYENDQCVWEKEFRPDGRLKSYSRKFVGGSGELAMMDDGHIYRLSCLPAAKDDAELRKVCGFGGAVTTSIYDGTGKVARVQTWKDGVLQKQTPGTSDYGSRSEVAFKDGKKHGEERVFDKNGRLAELVTWQSGVKDGREVTYAAGDPAVAAAVAVAVADKANDAAKVVKETLWSAGEVRQTTSFYLNGNAKMREVFEAPGKSEKAAKKQVSEFWDTGKASREGAYVRCDSGGRFGSRGWCETGVHRSFFESGAPESETTFQNGKRHGSSKSWWANGKPAAVEEYADDRCVRAKRWDSDGVLKSDDEFEADGSRKLKK